MNYPLLNRIYACVYILIIDIAIYNYYGKASLIMLLPFFVVYFFLVIKISKFNLDRRSSKLKRVFYNGLKFLLYGLVIILVSNVQFSINYYVNNNRWIGFVDKLSGLSVIVSVLYVLIPYSLIMGYLVSRKKK